MLWRKPTWSPNETVARSITNWYQPATTFPEPHYGLSFDLIPRISYHTKERYSAQVFLHEIILHLELKLEALFRRSEEPTIKAFRAPWPWYFATLTLLFGDVWTKILTYACTHHRPWYSFSVPDTNIFNVWKFWARKESRYKVPKIAPDLL